VDETAAEQGESTVEFVAPIAIAFTPTREGFATRDAVAQLHELGATSMTPELLDALRASEATVLEWLASSRENVERFTADPRGVLRELVPRLELPDDVLANGPFSEHEVRFEGAELAGRQPEQGAAALVFAAINDDDDDEEAALIRSHLFRAAVLAGRSMRDADVGSSFNSILRELTSLVAWASAAADEDDEMGSDQVPSRPTVADIEPAHADHAAKERGR
jgi:hypothetical protein